MRESSGSNKRRATIAVFYLGYKKNVRYPGRSSYPRMTWSHQSTDTDKSLVCLYTGPRHRCLGFLHTHRYLQIGESRKEIGIEKRGTRGKEKKHILKLGMQTMREKHTSASKRRSGLNLLCLSWISKFNSGQHFCKKLNSSLQLTPLLPGSLSVNPSLLIKGISITRVSL